MIEVHGVTVQKLPIIIHANYCSYGPASPRLIETVCSCHFRGTGVGKEANSVILSTAPNADL